MTWVTMAWSRRCAALRAGFDIRRLEGRPYVLLVVALALLTTCSLAMVAAGRLEERYRAEFARASGLVQESLFLVEAEQAATLRQLAQTPGFVAAVQRGDVPLLHTQLEAERSRSTAGTHLAVQQADGRLILTVPPANPGMGVPAEAAAWLRPWPAPGERSRGPVVEASPRGAMLTSAVRLGEVGELVIGWPLHSLVDGFGLDLGGRGLALYNQAGELVVASGSDRAPSTLGPLATTVSSVRRGQWAGRPAVEVIGPLPMVRQPTLMLGLGWQTTAVEESLFQARTVLQPVLGLVTLFLLVLLAMALRQLVPVVRVVRDAATRLRHDELGWALGATGGVSTGALIRAFNDLTSGMQERERSRHAIERYLSPKVYEVIQNGDLRIGGESREITVLMTDIRDFTALAESMPPDALLSLLNRYFEAMFEPIARYEGEVDKYLGDGILAKFGATEWYPDHAARAVLAAVDMLAACDRLNLELRREGLPALRMGVGANTGCAIVGNVGSTQRMEYTIISDAVNTAERLGSLCKDLEWDLLISRETFTHASAELEVGEPLSVQLRGSSRETEVFPVLGRLGAVPPARRRRYYQLVAQREAATRRASRITGEWLLQLDPAVR